MFYLSYLRSALAGRIVFLMSQMSNVMELNNTRSYKASARAIANDCKKENGLRNNWRLLACTLVWQPTV